MWKYLPRTFDKVLSKRLASKGAVLVEGPKWCGKTTTCEQIANSVVYLQDPTTREQNLRLIQLEPSLFLAGETPRLIDEWQEAPELWDIIRFEIDKRNEFGQFILTGSSVPPDMSEVHHSGTGRITRARMRPMSLLESGEATGAVSLSALFDQGNVPVAQSKLGLEDVAYLLCRGGWPKAIGQPKEIALQQALDYHDAIVETDMSRVDGVKRSPERVAALMRSYARMSASQGAYETMRQDVNDAGLPFGESSLSEYIAALQKLFVTEDLRAWNPNLRSKTAIRTTPTRHFTDPSIAAASLGAGPGDLINDLETFGLLFETLCVRDLRSYIEPLDGEIRHYRDKAGRECDAVCCLRDGRYGLVEIKLGGKKLIEEGAESLLALTEALDQQKMRQPSFMIVLTANGDYSYSREDGVGVVPIGTLGV